ncbi:hypothetical protein F2Q69_00060136 [Brassica cretica]|uniref:Uncharacterized protein n=1 Tax=Brassica cretica TaxID=69181 RepID=A0A8S9RGS7_BRACR|nr:hypothetical protein F2Q69_00060136 [Brassica cretica]
MSVVSGILALLKVERVKIGVAPYDGCLRTLVERIKPFVVHLGVKQVLAAKKAKEREKKEGKAVASSSRDEGEEEPAPLKKTKMSKGKGIAVERDMSKTPTVEELYHHLAKGVSWVPTRFADTKMMEECGNRNSH